MRRRARLLLVALVTLGACEGPLPPTPAPDAGRRVRGLSGRFVPPEPFDGASTLEVFAPDARGEPLFDAPLAQSWPGRDGRFEFPDVRDGAVVLVWRPLRDGTPPALFHAVAPARGLTLQLARGATLTGEVREPDGGPSDARVQLLSVPGRRSQAEGSGPTFRFEWVQPGEFDVEVDPPGPTVTAARCQRRRVAVDGGTQHLVVQLGLGWTLEGRVTDTRGRPHEATFVEARPPGDRDLCAQRHTLTDERGRFVLRDLPGDEVELEVHGVRSRVKRGAGPARVQLQAAE